MVRAHILLITALTLAMGCSGKDPARPVAGGKLQVVASIFPLADAARQIGGTDAEVVCLLPPGRSPHGFQPTPQDADALNKAQLVLMIGMGMDDWSLPRSSEGRTVVRLAERPAFRQAIVQTATSPASAPAYHDDHDEHEAPGHAAAKPANDGHRHDSGDPHVWLDPVLMDVLVGEMAEAMATADPAHRTDYMTRRDAYLVELRKLDEEYRQTLSKLHGRKFVTFHEAFGHLARRYKLEELALHDAEAGGFGPDKLEQVARFIRDNHLTVIFAEPQYPADRLEALAKVTGARIGRLDPEGNPDVKGYDSYLAMMRGNLAALTEGLRE